MAEKKITTKKITKEKETKPVEKPAVVEEIKSIAPTFVAPVRDLAEEIEEKAISEEIDKTIKETAKSDRYYEAIGRRKTAVARVRLYTKGDKEFLVNDQPFLKYFQTKEDQEVATASMKKMKCLDKFRITVIVKGGGHSAQAGAIRHGTARVLVDFNANFRKRLRKAGFLTRDPRMRERKKFGLKRARKSPQWAKR